MSKQNKQTNSSSEETKSKQQSRGNKWKQRKTVSTSGQPRKDSKEKRVNYDNTRIDKYERDRAKAGANDITWYSKNPELLKSSGSFPFNSVLGSTAIGDYVVPGIMTLPWCPAFGPDTVAINQSFNSMFSYTVHANSRNYSWNSPDLGVLTMAGAQVFSILGAMMRAFGLTKYYQERNAYVPDVLLASLGFDAQSMRNNLAQIWFDLNNLIDQTRQIWIPDVLPVVDRWFWLNTNLFTDAEGVTSQIYAYVQDRYFIYSETGSQHGGACFAVKLDGTVYNPVGTDADSISNVFNPAINVYQWSQWRLVCQKMIDALISSEDRGIIYGDLLNAYGSDRIKSLPQIQSDFTIFPVYNAEVQSQIENYTPIDITIDALAQTQSSAQLMICYHPKFVLYDTEQSSSYAGMQQAVLNFHGPNTPSPEAVIVATRMTSIGAVPDTKIPTVNPKTGAHGTASGYVPLAVGTEIAHQPIIYTFSGYNSESGKLYDLEKINLQYTEQSGDSNYFKNVLGDMNKLMAFDWHPFMYRVAGTIPANSYTSIVNASGDWDNYTSIQWTELLRMHKVCTLSEFGVPHI